MWNHWPVVTVRKTFARECIDRSRWLWPVSTCTADANDRIIRCGRAGVPVRTAASFRRNYWRLYDAWGTRVTNERCRAHWRIRSSRSSEILGASFPREYFAKIQRSFYASTAYRNNSPSTTRHSTDDFIAKCAPRREDRVGATAKVGPPPWRKSFLFRRARVRKRPYSLPVGCIMQRLFEVRPFPPFSLGFTRSPSLSPLPSISLFSLLFALFRREAASAARRPRLRFAGEMRYSRGSRETDISRYKRERFTAKWIDYSVLRSRQRREERWLWARAGKREQCSAAHLRFCLDERMEIALL